VSSGLGPGVTVQGERQRRCRPFSEDGREVTRAPVLLSVVGLERTALSGRLRRGSTRARGHASARAAVLSDSQLDDPKGSLTPTKDALNEASMHSFGYGGAFRSPVSSGREPGVIGEGERQGGAVDLSAKRGAT
jgi:hypothetical protein